MKNKKRTDIDFSKHIVLESHFKNENHSLDVWDLKLNDNSYYHRVKFINSCGVLTVDGDFGRWSFNREFHPSKNGYVSDYYWCEKLQIGSKQEYSKYDSEKTKKELKNLIKSGLKEYGYEGNELTKLKEDFKELLDYVDDEIAYSNKAYRGTEIYDYELIPFCKTIDNWLLAVFDAFEELCKRIEDE